MTAHDREGTPSGNQGEGNREAAREYDKQQHDFVKAGRVEKSAQEAKRAVKSDEREDLEKAEEAGKAHAKEFDPNVKRD